MPLTEAAVRGAKPREKPYKLFDEKGLYLLVTKNESSLSRLWRFKYRFHGHEKLLSLGAYPEVSLKRAREKRDEARRTVADRIDPSVQRRTARAAQADTFEAIALEWLGKQAHLKDVTTGRDRERLRKYVFPTLGSRPIRTIQASEVLAALRRIESGGRLDTAHRVRALCGRVFRYGIATGRADRDVAADLKGALAARAGSNYAAITDPKQVGALLRAIDGYVGQPSTHAALRLAPLVFVRPGELRGAQWSELELEGRDPQWRIPGERMKMGELHVVPLSRQAVAILEDLQALTGDGTYLFPSLRSASKPISDNTLNAALRRLGYSGDDMVAHGFRAMASTLLNEQGFHPDLIELQLAHAERNKVRAAYNRATRLAERRKMMQSWADYLDALKASSNVVPIRRAAG